MELTPQNAAWFAETFAKLTDNVGQALLGKAPVIRLALTCMLAEGHQITNHGYRHIIFGKKPAHALRLADEGLDRSAIEGAGKNVPLLVQRSGNTLFLALNLP